MRTMNTVDIKSEFGELFPWHYDPLDKHTNDCPAHWKNNYSTCVYFKNLDKEV